MLISPTVKSNVLKFEKRSQLNLQLIDYLIKPQVSCPGTHKALYRYFCLERVYCFKKVWISKDTTYNC